MSRFKTRSDDMALKIIGESLDEEKHIKITCSRFPSNKHVLLCLLANRARFYRENKIEKVDLKSKQQVHEQLLVHYKRVGKVPILTPKAIFYKIGKLFDGYIKQCKNKAKYSSHAAFLSMLNETFKVWPKNAVNILEKHLLSPVLTNEEKDEIREDIIFI